MILVDMGISNLTSVTQALRRMGVSSFEMAIPENITRAKAIILPGVGAFGDGMASLRHKGLIEPIRRAAVAGVPILGICLGMQLLAEESEEHGQHKGLGLIRSHVIRLQTDQPGYRVPNIGWCDVTAPKTSVLFPEGYEKTSFYFVHSYHLETHDKMITTAFIEFSGRPITVAIENNNIFGVQFHPEKSQSAGLELLANFCKHINE